MYRFQSKRLGPWKFTEVGIYLAASWHFLHVGCVTAMMTFMQRKWSWFGGLPKTPGSQFIESSMEMGVVVLVPAPIECLPQPPRFVVQHSWFAHWFGDPDDEFFFVCGEILLDDCYHQLGHIFFITAFFARYKGQKGFTTNRLLLILILVPWGLKSNIPFFFWTFCWQKISRVGSFFSSSC